MSWCSDWAGGPKEVSVLEILQTNTEAHPTSYPVSTRARAHSWVQRPGHGVYHSLLSVVEVKNKWSYTSTPPVYLHGADRENLTHTSQRTFRFLYEDQ
jgi:hypothetical protein